MISRYKHIRELVREDAEAQDMAIADEDSRYLRDYHRALATIAGGVLGYKGRKLAREWRRKGRVKQVAIRCRKYNRRNGKRLGAY